MWPGSSFFTKVFLSRSPWLLETIKVLDCGRRPCREQQLLTGFTVIQVAEWEQEKGPLFCMRLFIGLSPNYTVRSWISTFLVVLSIGMSLGI